jgi:DNA (cytosine-5)-methyltransferase 1
LQKNFKNIPIEEDIRNVKGSNYTADIVSGGFPCQPFSVAGKRRGQDDDRYLWDETIRVVAETKPKWFVGENVEGIININNGLVLRQVQTDLEKEGFQVQCLVIPASGIGAWHQRKRVWIIGCNVSNSDKSRSFKEYSTSFNRQDKRDGFINESSSRLYKNVPNTNSGLRRGRGTEQESRANEIWRFYTPKEEQTEQHIWSKAVGCDALPREDVQNTNSIGLQGHRLQSDNLQKKDKSRKVFNSSFKKQQTWWQTQSELCGVPHGISYELDKDRSNRIKSLGNSIVPQIAYEIGKAIVDAEISQD